jgi:hypothetical protein
MHRAALRTLSLTVSLVVAFGVVRAGATSIVLIPGPAAGKDAQIDNGSPANNYGNEQSLTVNWGLNSRSIGLIEFDLSSIATGSTITDATLSLFHNSNEQTNARYDVFRVTSAWNEATVTFNTKPTFDPTAVATLTFTGDGNVYRNWDVTSVVQGWVDGSFGNFGLWIEEIPVQGTSSAIFLSSDAAANQRPILAIDTVDAVATPEPASMLLLGSGVAVLYARRKKATSK